MYNIKSYSRDSKNQILKFFKKWLPSFVNRNKPLTFLKYDLQSLHIGLKMKK